MITSTITRQKLFLVFVLSLGLALPQAVAQGGGASRGGAANTVEGTGRGAGGPGDGEGPGQGAGQGLGPGGRDKDHAEKENAEREEQDRERQQKEKAEKERAEKEQREREEQEKADKEREEKEKLEKDRREKEKADKDRQEKERAEKERAEKEKAEKEKSEREKEQRDREEKERADKERREKERTEREKQERESREKEKSEKERNEREQKQPESEKKQQEDRERPTIEKSEDTERPEQRDPEPQDRPGRPIDEQPDRGPGNEEESSPENGRGDGKPQDPGQKPEQTEQGEEPSRQPRGEEDRPRESSGRTADDVPARPDLGGERLVPEAPTRDLVPGAENIPGAADAERALRSLSDPAAARDGFLGLLFGGRRAAPAAEGVALSTGKGVVAAERASRVRRSRGAFLGMFRVEVPDLVSAAKVQRVEIDPRVTSPRTLTYKSRFSRVSRWVGPLTLGLLNYVPFETMNAAVSGRINNLMSEEKISVEDMAARVFAENLAEGKRFAVGSPPQAFVELEITRYALDPVPTSLGRMKPTVSLTGRLYSPSGRLLWIGKGFSTIAERGIKGATVEQYEDNPAALRADFDEAVRVASRRLAMQANALPRAKITVVPPTR